MKSTKKATCALRRVLLLILILSLALTSCGQAIEEPVDPREVLPDEWTVGYTGDWYTANCWDAGCKGNRYYDMNNVEITLSYGCYFSQNIEIDRMFEVYTNVDIYFFDSWKNGAERQHFVRRTEDELSSEKYRVTHRHVTDENGEAWLAECFYNHSEVVHVPSELFTENIGSLRIGIYGENLAQEKESRNYHLIMYTAFWYIKISESEIMLLSPKEYYKYYDNAT